MRKAVRAERTPSRRQPAQDLDVLNSKGGNLIGLIGPSFSFGTVPVDTTGQSPVTETFSLMNFGASDLTLSSIGITSGSSEFTVSGIAPGTVIQAGETASLTVSFDPTAIGSASANLQIVSNDPNSPDNISLTGLGRTVHRPAPVDPGQRQPRRRCRGQIHHLGPPCDDH